MDADVTRSTWFVISKIPSSEAPSMDADVNRSTWSEKLVCRDIESPVVVRGEIGEPEYNRESFAAVELCTARCFNIKEGERFMADCLKIAV